MCGIKVAQEYNSNAIKFVSMKNLKLIDLKSCNISMQQLLLVSIHDIYAKKKKIHTIIRLCFLFNVICNKVINPLSWKTLLLLCKLKMQFFFLHYNSFGCSLGKKIGYTTLFILFLMHPIKW